MEKASVKSFYAILASLTGLGILSWIYIVFKKRNDAKDTDFEEREEDSDNKTNVPNFCKNQRKITETSSLISKVDVTSSLPNENINIEKETSLVQNNKDSFLKEVTKTNIIRSANNLPVFDKKVLIENHVVPQQTKVIATNQFHSFEEKTSFSNNHIQKHDFFTNINDNNLTPSFQTLESQNRKDFFLQKEGKQNTCLMDSTHVRNHAISSSILMLSDESEKITNVVSPIEIEDEDSLEESDRDNFETKNTKSECRNVLEIKNKKTVKNFSEENIDCGLGESLREEGMDEQEPRSNILQNIPQGYFLHDFAEKIDSSSKIVEKKNFQRINERNFPTDNKTNNRMLAIFKEHPEKIKTNSDKFKSKIPSFSSKSINTALSIDNLNKNKTLNKGSNLQNMKDVKKKNSETSNYKRRTNIKKPIIKTKVNTSNNNFKEETINSFELPKNMPLKSSNIPSKSENVLIDKLEHNQVNDKIINFELNRKSNVNVKDNVESTLLSSDFILSLNNLDDSLEDVSRTFNSLADSLEELSGIMDESPCLDFIIDDDVDENIGKRPVDGKLKDFSTDLSDDSNGQFCKDELYILEIEKEGLEVFESDSNKINDLKNNESIFEDSENVGLLDQNYFFEQSENELLLNLASQNKDIDSFISLLSRTSISKLHRDQCWKYLEKLSIASSNTHFFNHHIFFLVSLIDKLISHHHSYQISPLKVIFNLSKRKESILFILAARTSKSIFRLMLLETREEVLLNWLPLVANLLHYIKQEHVTSNIIWYFCCQQKLYQQQLPQPIEKQTNKKQEEHLYSSSTTSQLGNLEEKIMNETLFHFLFGQQSRQILMDKVYILTNHPNTHLTHLARCLYTSLVHS